MGSQAVYFGQLTGLAQDQQFVRTVQSVREHDCFQHVRVLEESHIDKCRLQARSKENPQRFYALKMEQTPFILMCNDAVSKVNLLGVRRDLELRNVQGTVRTPRGSPLWCLECLGAAVTHVSFIRCGVTASCPLRVEELKGTDII